MEQSKYFREALANFTHAAASGGAIEHLADLGYTPQEIKDMLDFPTPYERVRETYWNHLVERRIIVEEKAALAKPNETVRFVTDHDSYGRTSIRRIVETKRGDGAAVDFDAFQRTTYNPGRNGAFAGFLKEHCGTDSYISCDFGIRKEICTARLTEKQRLYIEGVPWRAKPVWHQLDERMAEITAILWEYADYHGELLLLGDRQQILF